MFEIKDDTIKLSVRSLVEFILRRGDIDTSSGRQAPDAMQEGSRIHRKIQKRMGSNYQAEVPLNITVPLQYKETTLHLVVEGRADGIIHNQSHQQKEEAEIIIDEIKGVYRDLSSIKEPVEVHKAQAMCYAYMYAVQKECKEIGVRLTYCNIETENIQYFEDTLTFEELKQWFEDLVKEFSKWVFFEYKWRRERNQEIRKVEFPFDYRVGQKELVTGVYRSIIRDKKLFIEAPTGVGKTISTIFPTVKAMGEEEIDKIFYLTAKTITRTVAEETFRTLKEQGLKMKVITITAKEKVCVLDQVECNPVVCERAKGHYDRVNAAVYDLITSEDDISRELIEKYAKKHNVCPFEMCLDVTVWCDAIICDYNYVFDPNVYLRRFFSDEKKRPYCFLVDEAHNLVDRAREMYSAVLYKKDILHVKKLVADMHPKLRRRLEVCNQDFLKIKRECDEVVTLNDIGDIVLHLMRAMTEFDEFLQENIVVEGRDEIVMLYLQIRHFLNMYEIHDERYIIYADYDESNDIRLQLMCIDTGKNISNCLKRGKSSILFSATLLPIHYYKEHLGGNEDDYAVYAPSPFQKQNRCIMIGQNVSTKYSRRSLKESKKIMEYILTFIQSKVGNYLVFFPSYQMMNELFELITDKSQVEKQEISITYVRQESNMTEQEKEEFLASFVENPCTTRVGFCVMGGIFGEGIDLKRTRCSGAVIVGTGLPMVCNERELMREFYQATKGRGFDYAYLYQGMNKVLQSAGRVIRTIEDYGAILLLDERFLQKQYQALFPREWHPFQIVTKDTMRQPLEEFWAKETSIT